MAVDPIASPRYGYSPIEALPNGTDQPGFSPEALPTGELIDRYFNLRETAADEALPDPGAISWIQGVVRSGMQLDTVLKNDQLPYGRYDPAAVDRFRQLNQLLREKYGHVVPQSVLDASDAFIDMVDGMYHAAQEGREDARLADGAFGFVVPARASRSRPQDSVETIDPCPSLRYVPDELRVAMYAGLPPFIVDRFNPNQDGKRGYMILAPVFPDMQQRHDRTDMALGAIGMVNEAVKFGRDMLGIRVFGLGASLPAITRYGEYLYAPDVITTTGHGGTIALILKTMEALEKRGAIREGRITRISVLGLGSIGASIAQVVADAYPNAQITIYDPKKDLRKSALDTLTANDEEAKRRGGKREREITAATDMHGALKPGGIVISAIANRTGKRLDLAKELSVDHPDLRHIDAVIDDSQPWMLDREQLEEFGTRIVWVVGNDPSGRVAQRSSTWSYGGTLTRDGEFGCALEAASIAQLLDRVEKHLKLRESEGYVPIDAETGERVAAIDLVRAVALREAVTPDRVQVFSALFDQLGIVAAPFESEGRPVDFSKRLPRHRRWLSRLGRIAAAF